MRGFPEQDDRSQLPCQRLQFELKSALLRSLNQGLALGRDQFQDFLDIAFFILELFLPECVVLFLIGCNDRPDTVWKG